MSCVSLLGLPLESGAKGLVVDARSLEHRTRVHRIGAVVVARRVVEFDVDSFGHEPQRELDAFVESITYREARGYVRKVMTSYITYSGLYGDGRLPTLQMTVPKKLRKWGDIPEVEKMQPGDAVSQKEQKPVSSKRG